MKILCVSGYPAWDKVSQGKMPSHHLFGIHEMVDRYEEREDKPLRGILSSDAFSDGGYVDFYFWTPGKNNILKHVKKLLKMSKDYDVIFDQLNRCSIYLGLFKKIGMLKCKLLTIMHHPPYDLQLKISDSDGYIFFNEDYKELAERTCAKKKNKYYVNEWFPDVEWYDRINNEGNFKTNAFFIDNGKSRRDRVTLIAAAESSKIRVDYAGNENGENGYARPYNVDLKDDIAMVQRLKEYKAVVIPVSKNGKNKIGPLGITSFLDCIALCLPVIASENVCFAKDIEKYKLGLIYKTGDPLALSEAMKKMAREKDCYAIYLKNMQVYRNKCEKSAYSQNIKEIMRNITWID